ncbi:MAG: D-glycero-alpha-D-manno-heptose-7-phosphate kinase, partial [Acetobacteraceae bacterium]|nr:D-glycero-alpha-D-manno-heptose-7-phosphate kinase [Acetobacteraceae bacterium]
SVLSEQKSRTPANLDVLMKMRHQAHELRRLFSSTEIDIERLGHVLHEGWEFKRRLGSKITTSEIDRYYDSAMAAGAEGGKLCGAGGGGFLMFLVKPQRRDAVRQALNDLKYVSLGHEVHGSRVLYPAQ